MIKIKYFIAVVLAIILVFAIGYYSYFDLGYYIDFNPNAAPTTFTSVKDKTIYVDFGNGFEPFEVKGVNMGIGYPGKYAVEYGVDEETYLKWFEQISEMNANTLRVYTYQSEAFYNAFYKFNTTSDKKLYLIHGVWIDDYVQNSHSNALDVEYIEKFIDNTKKTIDIIHGRADATISKNSAVGVQHYRLDISQWVIGYILGVEWEDATVEFTNNQVSNKKGYKGKYMYTDENATTFETMLCRVGDTAIEYETSKYKQQRLVAFSNWCTTDPFDYDELVTSIYNKYAKVTTENIKTTDKFISGVFASYHVYPYYPDYYIISKDLSKYKDENGEVNTYKAYLTDLNNAHSVPVVITEFGLPTSRAMAAKDYSGADRSQGGISEHQQAEGLIKCYEDIKAAGCNGGIVFSWQDEWFKRTWNTMQNVNLDATPFWSDYQTNEQYFGLLSFDPGKEQSVCYTDGDVSEWSNKDIVSKDDNLSLSMKYDEKYIYFMVNKKNYDFENDTLYIPIDTTQKSGSNYCADYNIKFSNNADFVIKIHGKDDSRVVVQEYYDVFKATKQIEVTGVNQFDADNIPDKNSSKFNPINLIIQSAYDNSKLTKGDAAYLSYYETGKLTYGIGNPSLQNFDSMSDFCVKGDYVEIRIPWELLNFANPSKMQIHDDYYINYGVRYIYIDKMYVGISTDKDKGRIEMTSFALKEWGETVTFHERLKEGYYALKDEWAKK